jgi:DNA excision repair protein ERCC-4
MKDKKIIIVDTREKNPWMFDGLRGIKVVRGTLRTGDYSIKGGTLGTAIERKSIPDLFGSMTSGRRRFYDELRRLSEYSLAAVVVEGTRQEAERWKAPTSINVARMLRTLQAWCARFGVQLHFCEGRLMAEQEAYRILVGWAESREKRV